MRLFISYARVDNVIAQRLADDLAKNGYGIWLDVRNIPHGANWDNEVQRGLDDSDVMLVLLSPASAASQNVGDEWSYFIERGKRILPLMIQPCDVPFRLSRRQRVDFIQGYDQGLVELLHALNEPPDSIGAVGAVGAAASTGAPALPSAGAGIAPPRPAGAASNTLRVSWADGYHWWRGLTPKLATGDSLVMAAEWRLIGVRRLPLIIGLDNLTKTQVMHSAWDTYLAVTFHDSADQAHTLIVTGTDRRTRTATVNALYQALTQAAGRSLN